MGIRGSDTPFFVIYRRKGAKRKIEVGPEGFGFRFAMETLAGGRIGIAAQALGIASGGLRNYHYNTVRKENLLEKNYTKHQSIAFKLADMATDIEISRLLCLKSATQKDECEDYNLSSSMAKLHCAESAMKITTEAVQIHGGYGFVKEYHVERMMRDAKITQIYEGTSEIQKIVISRAVLKE